MSNTKNQHFVSRFYQKRFFNLNYHLKNKILNEYKKCNSDKDYRKYKKNIEKQYKYFFGHINKKKGLNKICTWYSNDVFENIGAEENFFIDIESLNENMNNFENLLSKEENKWSKCLDDLYINKYSKKIIKENDQILKKMVFTHVFKSHYNINNSKIISDDVIKALLKEIKTEINMNSLVKEFYYLKTNKEQYEPIDFNNYPLLKKEIEKIPYNFIIKRVTKNFEKISKFIIEEHNKNKLYNLHNLLCSDLKKNIFEKVNFITIKRIQQKYKTPDIKNWKYIKLTQKKDSKKLEKAKQQLQKGQQKRTIILTENPVMYIFCQKISEEVHFFGKKDTKIDYNLTGDHIDDSNKKLFAIMFPLNNEYMLFLHMGKIRSKNIQDLIGFYNRFKKRNAYDFISINNIRYLKNAKLKKYNDYHTSNYGLFCNIQSSKIGNTDKKIALLEICKDNQKEFLEEVKLSLYRYIDLYALQYYNNYLEKEKTKISRYIKIVYKYYFNKIKKYLYKKFKL